MWYNTTTVNLRFCASRCENEPFPLIWGFFGGIMNVFLLVSMIVLLALGVLLTIAVLMQHGKSYGLSGTIAGGAETFFGKDKGRRIDKVLSRVTTILGAVFIVLALLIYVVQPGNYQPTSKLQSFNDFANSFATEDDHTHE